MNYKLSILKSIINPDKFVIYKDIAINTIYTDTRVIFDIENALFIALKTKQNDGHQYIQQAIDKGINCFLIQQDFDTSIFNASCSYFAVDNTWQALHKIAQHHRAQYNPLTIGITGSNGKTITKEFLYQLLENDYQIIRSPKSFNSQLGVPISVLMTKAQHNLAIWEAGISKIGEMAILEKIIQPHWGIFTSIGSAHKQNFESRLAKINEKLDLFRNCELIFYCLDHINIHNAVKEHPVICNIPKKTWGIDPLSDFRINHIRKTNITTVEGIYQNINHTFHLNFIDKAYVEDALHCILLLLHLGYSNESINQKLNFLSPMDMRLEVKKGINNTILINDAYSLDMSSLRAGLDFLLQQPKQENTVILSDFSEAGKNYKEIFLEVQRLLLERNIKQLIGIGEAFKTLETVFDKLEINTFETVEQFINQLSTLNLKHKNILIKGARIFHFEKILNALEERKAETYLEISLGALLHNYRYLKSLLKPKVKTMAMVKAYGYGIGSVEMANLLQHYHVNYFGVAFIDEGITLRQNNITTPIMIMNTDINHLSSLQTYNLEPEIYNFRILNAYINTIKKQAIVEAKIHIKIDTGMHRLGFEENEITALVLTLQNNKTIRIASIFSHLAGSDDPNLDDFTNHQIQLFSKIAHEIETAIGYTTIKHISNSQGIIRYPNAQFDMVRLGISLYGLGNSNLENVTSLYTHISQIKTVHKGETVGYGRKGKIEKESKIATLPIGYADGLKRSFGNGVGSFIIRDQKASIIGNVCMDMCMVDVTNIDCEEGDEVILFNNQHTVKNLADQIDTIPYEILTSISPRLSRVYVAS